jgi:hypothetical protein
MTGRPRKDHDFRRRLGPLLRFARLAGQAVRQAARVPAGRDLRRIEA